MPKTRAQKQAAVEDLAEILSANDAIFVVSPSNVNPNEAADLKIKLQEIGGEYHLVKNSLFKLALEKSGLEYEDSFAKSQNAVVINSSDKAPESAKIIKQFIEETEKLNYKGGYLEKSLISAEQVQALAELPSREQILAQVLATMQAPVSGFVRVLGANTRDLLYVLNNIKDKKQA